MTGAAPAGLEIRPVSGGAELRDFIDVPWHIYADDAQWVPPLRLERRFQFSRFNPFFEHGSWQGFNAYRGGRAVGRVSAHIDELHRQRYGQDTGHFGFLEAEDDPGVFAALMDAAEGWLIARGTRRVTGPFNFSVNQESGLLVEGFDRPPVLLMTHARKWYAGRLEEQGYHPVKDLLAYWVRADFETPEIMRKLLERYRSRMTVRKLRRRSLGAEMEILRDIFNDGWSNNWGFVPFTRAEFAELGQSLRFFVDDDLVHVAEVDGEPAAFVAALPNLNEVFRELNGKLLPWGWLRLWRRLKQHQIRTARTPLMGVRKRYRNSPLGIALAYSVIDAVRWPLHAKGMNGVELSWILEDNAGMRNVLDSMGSTVYKRYRIYEKRLGGGNHVTPG